MPSLSPQLKNWSFSICISGYHKKQLPLTEQTSLLEIMYWFPISAWWNCSEPVLGNIIVLLIMLSAYVQKESYFKGELRSSYRTAGVSAEIGLASFLLQFHQSCALHKITCCVMWISLCEKNCCLFLGHVCECTQVNWMNTQLNKQCSV